MRRQYLALTPKEIAEYLQEKGAFERKEVSNKVHELAAALVLARLHLKQTNQHSIVVLPLRGPEVVTIAKTIESNIDEDDPIDIRLIDADDARGVQSGKVKGKSFQIKRFNLKEEDATEELIKYLTEKIPRHYAPTGGTSLVLLLENTGSVNLKKVNEMMTHLDNYPFSVVLYMYGNEKEGVTIGEMWPQNGLTVYTNEEWFRDALKGE